MAQMCISTKEYKGEDALHNVVSYIIRESKTCGDYGGQGVLLSDPILCMNAVRKYYQNEGKQILHFWLSFSKYEYMTVPEAMNIGCEVAKFFADFQVVFGCHQDTEYLHVHWAINPVNIRNGKKLTFKYADTYELKKYIDNVLDVYGIRCDPISYK